MRFHCTINLGGNIMLNYFTSKNLSLNIDTNIHIWICQCHWLKFCNIHIWYGMSMSYGILCSYILQSTLPKSTEEKASTQRKFNLCGVKNNRKIQSTLPKSTPLGLKKTLGKFNLCGVKEIIENKDKGACIGLGPRQLFNLCEVDWGRVNCRAKRTWVLIP